MPVENALHFLESSSLDGWFCDILVTVWDSRWKLPHALQGLRSFGQMSLREGDISAEQVEETLWWSVNSMDLVLSVYSIQKRGR